MTDRYKYPAQDLDAMKRAVKYRGWILDLIRPFVGTNVLEVGAGRGEFSDVILRTKPDRLTLIEPSTGLALTTRERFRSVHSTAVVVYEKELSELNDILESKGIDTVVYVNVLEHVEDDQREIALTHHILTDNGHVVVFSPALPALLGGFDLSIGHYRRYKTASMRVLLEKAGFEVVRLEYVDFVGAILWWLRFKLFRGKSLRPGDVAAYDWLVPFVRKIDRLLGPPIGKNVLAVGRKIRLPKTSEMTAR